MIKLHIEEVVNGYIVYTDHAREGYMPTARHIATDVHALGLLIKQLAGAEKHKQCQAKRKL